MEIIKDKFKHLLGYVVCPHCRSILKLFNTDINCSCCLYNTYLCPCCGEENYLHNEELMNFKEAMEMANEVNHDQNA